MDDFKKVEVNSLYYRLFDSIVRAMVAAGILSLLSVVWMAYAAKSWIVFFIGYGILFVIAFLYGTTKGLLEYIHLQYKLAEQSVNFRSGLLSVRTTTIPYSKITNAAYDQNPIARLFSVGDINIDQEDSSFEFKSIGSKIADEILDVIAKKSNVLPISSQK
ncbi:PH domain-containing protein [Candidatus Daviesbacteria bacterium]|nr:PH domain-containing protein [Candidatus Daviesbacteria bacterium]